MRGVFVTGTDTGVGKTVVACALLRNWAAQGRRAVGMKPVAAGIAAVVLALLGGTTWLSGGFWAPDGAYSRFVSPIIGVVWVLVVSRILLTRSPTTRAAW